MSVPHALAYSLAGAGLVSQLTLLHHFEHHQPLRAGFKPTSRPPQGRRAACWWCPVLVCRVVTGVIQVSRRPAARSGTGPASRPDGGQLRSGGALGLPRLSEVVSG